jgi:beta-aspartyl-peptidase (threonine type)
MNQKTAIAIHGGAGTIAPHILTPQLEIDYRSGLKAALEAGNKVLKSGGTATEAVLAAVVELENNPLFNAGKGGVFNHLGQHEMDAAIMEGQFLKAGAVCGVKNIKNPVLLAQAVMTKSPHVMMAGDGAEAFAKTVNIEFADNAYFHTEHRYQQWLDIKGTENYQLDHTAKSENKMGTVGAVALDNDGNIAAATSTGGMTNKKFGRVGDSPIIGAGTYANNETCAISCTGHGELFIRSVVAYDISCLMAYKGLTLKQACEIVVMDKLVKIEGEGGLVAIDAHGNIEMPFNSEGMYRASLSVNGEEVVKIYE